MNTPKLGEATCKCHACGRFFTTTANFDKHRAGDHDILRYCVDPASVGLVLRENGAWGGKPMTEQQKRERGWLS